MPSPIALRGLHSRCLAFFAALAFGVLASASAAAPTADWTLSYQGKSSNAFIWDKRAKTLVRDAVPAKVAADVLSGLGGPPDPVRVAEERYVSVSACVAHACPDKGFFWVDSKTGSGLGGYLSGDTLTLGSKRLPAGDIPAAAVQAVGAWLSDNDAEPKSVKFLGATGGPVTLAVQKFTSDQAYRPAPDGPSFDCRKAATKIERAICGDPALSQQDLDLAMLFKNIRRGHDTVGARDQLRTFQRDWLKTRNAACEVAQDVRSCVGEQYRQQQDKLMNWRPAR